MPLSISLSAAALTTFERCPRQFQYLYLDQLGFGGSSPEQDRGRQFHRLVELHSQGFSVIDRLPAVDPQVQQWWRVFESSPHWDPAGEVRSELPLWIQVEGWRIVARLDRLLVPQSPAPVEILDWKTSQNRLTARELAQSWQVKLYPLLVWQLSQLLFGSSLSPDRIQLIFWYVQHPAAPQVIAYSQSQAEQDLNSLRQTLTQIESALLQGFPMTTQGSICEQCPFRGVCFGLIPLSAGIPELSELERSELEQRDPVQDWNLI